MSVKFTQLPAATLPLTGAEILALVQGGISKQAPASALGGSSAAAWTLTAAAAIGAGTTNDLLVATINNVNRLLLTPAGDAFVTGLQGGFEGQQLVFQNLSAVFSITLVNEDPGSAIGNRIVGPFGGDVFIPPRGAALCMRDLANVNRWVKV